MPPISILHVINGGIGVGGAERMLCRIVQRAESARFEHTVLTILPCLHLESEMRAAGVRFVSLDVRRRGLSLPGLLAIAPRLAGTERVNLYVGWLNYGGVLASLLGLAPRRTPVVLNFRSTPTPEDLRRPIMRAMRALAPRAARRLANSRGAVERLEAAGFGRVDFLANGFSPEEFQRDAARGAAFRVAHGIPLDAFVFGHVGRFHPIKNQAGILRAAAEVLRQHDTAHVALVGRALRNELAAHVPPGDLARRVHLLDGVEEPQDAYSSFDAYVHNSDFEGFPNVVAEAMLESLPIVCSDAGESRAIVGPDNRVVPPQRDDLLAAAMLEVVRLPTDARLTLGASNRARVAERYSVERSVREFEQHFADAAGGR